MDYRTVLIDSRQGVNLTVSEARAIADIVGPLLKNGQSPYQIIVDHPEIGITEKTLYNYIEGDIFHENRWNYCNGSTQTGFTQDV